MKTCPIPTMPPACRRRLSSPVPENRPNRLFPVPPAFRPILCLAVMLYCLPGNALSANRPFESENLKYDIVYNWGIIWKKGAEATLSVDTFSFDGHPAYQAILSARTTPFADRIFRVRDTLYSFMHRDRYLPLYYAKIADEKKVFRKDEVFYYHTEDGTHGFTSLIRPGKNEPDTFSLFSANRVFDMLSVFYYIRTLDFGKTEMHQRFPVDIFSGRHVEKMEIEYLGRTLITLPGDRVYSAYKVRLRFFGKTGEKVNENMTAWISEDVRRIPLMVEGRLPVGSLKAFYTGG